MCFAPDLINLDELSAPQKVKLKRKLQQCKELLQTRLKDVDQVLKKIEKKPKGRRRRK
jgi:hypothetical protein